MIIRLTLPDTPNYTTPRGTITEQVHVSIASLLVQPSPGKRRVGVRIDSFEAFSKLHSRYGPLDRSTAQGGLCHEASAQPVTRLRRSSASSSIDNCLDGTFLHR